MSRMIEKSKTNIVGDYVYGKEIIQKVIEKTETLAEPTREIYREIFSVIKEELVKGNAVHIPNFGVFYITHKTNNFNQYMAEKQNITELPKVISSIKFKLSSGFAKQVKEMAAREDIQKAVFKEKQYDR